MIRGCKNLGRNELGGQLGGQLGGHRGYLFGGATGDFTLTLIPQHYNLTLFISS